MFLGLVPSQSLAALLAMIADAGSAALSRFWHNAGFVFEFEKIVVWSYSPIGFWEIIGCKITCKNGERIVLIYSPNGE